MHFPLSSLAVAASLLASVNGLSATEIPADLPVSSLLSSAQSHLSKGQTVEALLYYDAAIAKDPTNYLTLFKRATTYLSLGRTNQATDDFNKVLTLKPTFEGAHLQLARIKARVGDWDGAKAQYSAANRGHETAEFHELEEAKYAAALAGLAEKSGNWDECVNQAGVAIMVATRSPSLREMRARCRFERGELTAGMADLQHVLQMKPGDTTPHVLISATSFYGLGDMDAGLAQIRKCLHSDPDNKVCKKLHRQEKAVQKTYNKAVGQLTRSQPTTAGRTLVGTKEEPGLVADIRRQVEELRQNGHIPPKTQAKLLNAVVELTCQAYSEANHRDANKYCDESLELDPDSFWALLHKGKRQFNAEEYEQAINTLTKAQEVRPDNRDKVGPTLQKAQIALQRSKTKDYYKILGVPHDADERQIKGAYRKATKMYHPDKAHKKGISKEEAEKKMAAINEAYEVLSDPDLRSRFDRGDDPNSNERPSGFGGQPFANGQPVFFHQGGRGGGGIKFNFHGGGGGGGGFPGGGFPF